MVFWPEVGIVASTVVAIVIPFLVVPEILEHYGYDPRSAFVRGIVWASFLVIIFIPAIATGYVFSITSPVDWLIGIGFLIVAVLWDYYRLNPERRPWDRHDFER